REIQIKKSKSALNPTERTSLTANDPDFYNCQQQAARALGSGRFDCDRRTLHKATRHNPRLKPRAIKTKPAHSRLHLTARRASSRSRTLRASRADLRQKFKVTHHRALAGESVLPQLERGRRCRNEAPDSH